ncbi:MAG TPA: ribbon-helix-helix protein, CopG family [Candidatus Methanoperedens sp.]|nr:ribbon-helix-helix protein, CopG family [Candidatus Methanoperedens sp.]
MIDKVRLQFDFSQEAVDKLDELKDRLGASSRAEVIRRALALMDRVSTSSQAGAEITIKSPKGEKQHLVLV